MRSIVIALVIVAGFAGAYYLGLRKRASRLNAFARHLRRSLRAGSVVHLMPVVAEPDFCDHRSVRGTR